VWVKDKDLSNFVSNVKKELLESIEVKKNSGSLKVNDKKISERSSQ